MEGHEFIKINLHRKQIVILKDLNVVYKLHDSNILILK